jgi:hypothetical protein
MARQWYYRRGDETHGPVSAQQLRELAGRGELRADDLVWSEDFDVSRAVPAAKLLQMAAPPAPGAAAPDWLGDVEKAEGQQGPAAPPVPAAEGVPDWVEDLRKVAADEEHRPPAASGTPGTPEWVGKLDVPPPLARRARPAPKKSKEPAVLGEGDLEILEPLPPEGELEILEPLPEGSDVELLEVPEGTDVELVETETVDDLDVEILEPPPP